MTESKDITTPVRKFNQNDRYSGEQGTVYTKDGDRYRRLVLEQKSGNGLEVRQTAVQDEIHGKCRIRVQQDELLCRKQRCQFQKPPVCQATALYGTSIEPAIYGTAFGRHQSVRRAVRWYGVRRSIRPG